MTAYDSQTNKLYLSTNNVTFDIQLRGLITLVEGDSATGKSLLCNVITKLQKAVKGNTAIVSTDGDVPIVENILCIDYQYEGSEADLINLLSSQEHKNKLIIIDNADTILYGKPNVVQFINLDRRNTYLIFSRGFLEFDVSVNYVAVFIPKEDKLIELHYIHSIEGWF
jgi:ABC-type dipeptide/oligopeptide/nickel transport system ATPase component